MKYIHPDIVIDKPIPEVEPRVDGVQLELAQSLVRWGRLGMGLVLVLIVGLAVFDASLKVRVVMMGVMLVGYLGVMFQPRHWRLMKQRRDQWKAEGKPKAHQIQQWGLPIRVQVELVCYQFLMIIASQGIVSVNSGLGGLSSFVAMGGVLIGGGLIMYGFRARQPGQVCCVDCEYPLVGLTIPCECPECGRMIYDPSWTTDRPRVRSGWFMWGGVFAMAFGGLIFYSSFANPGLMYGPMPRGVLLQLAPTEKGAFNQLIRRPMDQSQTDELIERLIAGNEGKGGWDFNTNDQQRWLSQFAGTGRVSRDQYERMFGRVADWVRIELVKTPGNKIVKVGKEAEVRLASTRYINLPDSGVIVRYFFNGFEIGDDADPVGGLKGENYLSFLDAKVGDRSYRYVPRASFTPTQSGLVVIRARVVVVMHAVRLGVPIRWDHPDGLFETEPEWWTMIELEDTIIIEP